MANVKRKAAAGSSRPAKRIRAQPDDTDRVSTAQHLAEHASLGSSYLSIRPTSSRRIPSLAAASLQKAGTSLRQLLTVDSMGKPSERKLAQLEWVRILPPHLSERLLAIASANRESLGSLDTNEVSDLFLRPDTLNFTFTGSTAAITLPMIAKLASCASLQKLDLTGQTNLKDGALARAISGLPNLEELILRQCVNVGDETVVRACKAAGDRLRVLNLNYTAVTKKGLRSLMARASGLEVLKLGNVNGLVSRKRTRSMYFMLTRYQTDSAVSKIVDDAICEWRMLSIRVNIC
jgi:hypothetical protein